MSTHLTQRGSTFQFQIAIPRHLQSALGRSPLRLNLGQVSYSRATYVAKVLAGFVTVEFSGADMTRESVSRGLAALHDELKKLSAVKFEILSSATRMTTQSRIDEAEARAAETIRVDGKNIFVAGGEVDDLMSLQVVSDRKYAKIQSDYRRVNEIHKQLQVVKGIIEKEGQEWGEEKSELETTVQLVGKARANVLTKLPRLSEIAPQVIEMKKKSLKKSSANYIVKLRRSVAAFIEIIGDKRISEYKPLDVQQFANFVGLFPRDWQTAADYKGLTFKQIVKKTENNRNIKRLSKSTVAEYVNNFRGIHKIIRATYPDFCHDLSHNSFSITAPRTAARAKTREPLSIENVNKFLKIAAECKRPDDRFLPLLAVLTGARLGEIVDLTVDDVRLTPGGHWMISLADDLDEDERQLKTDAARRVIALHDIFIEAGFLDWVEGIRRNRNRMLWPQLHQTKRPRSNASKRMNSLMKKAGVHAEIEQVFHSLRHTYKDVVRDLQIPNRILNRQVGHAPESVADSYGSKFLRDSEIAVLATLDVGGIDISPYVTRHREIGR